MSVKFLSFSNENVLIILTHFLYAKLQGKLSNPIKNNMIEMAKYSSEL